LLNFLCGVPFLPPLFHIFFLLLYYEKVDTHTFVSVYFHFTGAIRNTEVRLLRLLIVVHGLGENEAGVLAEGEVDAPGGGEDQQTVAAVILQ